MLLNDSDANRLGTINNSFLDESHVGNTGDISLIPNANMFKMQPFSLTFSLLLCLSIAISSAAIVLNYIVLRALAQVPCNVLKSKFLIMHSLIADIYIAYTGCFMLLPYLLLALGVANSYTLKCVAVCQSALITIALYSQCTSSVALASDRIYAVSFPLQYRGIGYSKAVTVIISVAIWLILVLLLLPATIPSLVTPLPSQHPGICYQLESGAADWTNKIRSNLQMGLTALTFVAYICIFSIVKLERRQNLAVKESSSREKKKMSLAVTYFLVHISTICLYLPGPIVTLLGSLGWQRYEKVLDFLALRQVVICVFLFNWVLNPYIQASRIPSIQKKMPISLSLKTCIADGPISSATFNN